MLRYMARSVAIAVVPFLFYFAFCNFLSSHPDAATALSMVGWAKAAYSGRADSFLAQCARYDARVTYLLRPGRCRFANVEFDTEINVNSFGLRDDEESLNAPEVIVLCDSHAMGYAVEDQEAFPQELEQLLGRKVLNAGVSSFGTARELMLLRLLDTTAARTIVIQYCDNDLDENQRLLQQGVLPISSESEYQRLVVQGSANYLNLLGPGLSVMRSAIGWIVPGKKGGKGDEIQAEAFVDVLARSTTLLQGRHIVILELTHLSRMNNHFINMVQSRSRDLGLDLTFVDVSTVLTPQDYLVLDSHMRPPGHKKVAALLARLIGGRTEAPGAAYN